MPGQTPATSGCRRSCSVLQWRAGQLPGQTREPRRSPATHRAGFNGGPDNCPARLPLRIAGRGGGPAASMEGRTIARPDGAAQVAEEAAVALQWRAGQLPGQTATPTGPIVDIGRSFNGGPDNCPARPCSCARSRPVSPRFNGGPDNCPARPPPSAAPHPPQPSFNGGPDNCPARRRCTASSPASWRTALQWRAGQLPGQTPRSRASPGPQHVASMEGRTIARPDVEDDDPR